MAILDASGNALVIRVVYDGAPLAGKTTSVAALGRDFGASVHSPAEVDGRTLYFDWLDYTGGLFEGHRIRCQIVSAPGQGFLAARRHRLLESADVVVFVGDSSPTGFASDREYLRSLGGVLKSLQGPPVGVVLQANKRDLPDAVPLDRMRDLLDDVGMKVGIVETVAKDGSGVREAFVFAVRLALDRVRELMQLNQLAVGRPTIGSADDLLADLRAQERNTLDLASEKKLARTKLEGLAQTRLGSTALQSNTMAVKALEEALQSDQQQSAPAVEPPVSDRVANPSAAPALPSEHVGSGLVWPPVDGRVILQEIGASAAKLVRLEDGGWYGRVGNRWHVRTPADARYRTVDQGRPALIATARAYANKCQTDSVERCAALASDGAGGVRLWHIKRIANAR